MPARSKKFFKLHTDFESGEKELEISGPNTILRIDFDDLDDERFIKIKKETLKIIELLNKHWMDE